VAYKYGKQLCFSSLCRFEQETIEDLNTGRWLKNHLETYESMVFQDYPKYMKWTCYHSCSKAPTRIQKLKLLFNQLGWKKKSARIFLGLIMADPLETENRWKSMDIIADSARQFWWILVNVSCHIYGCLEKKSLWDWTQEVRSTSK